MKQSQKLSHLLRLLWKNPVFGDSYPANVYEDLALLQIKSIYAGFSAKFHPILAEGMPQSSIFELDELFNQIAPKSVAFCAAIAAGDIEDTDRLCDAAVAIAISYWADQSMDRGDEAMLAAVRHINAELQKDPVQAPPPSEQVGARLAALRHIERLARKTNDHPDDLPYVVRAICRDVLANQAHVRDLSRQYLTSGGNPAFWDEYAEEAAQIMTSNSGLMSAVTVVYAVYRHYQPDIPSLAEIYQQPELAVLIGGPFNGAVRIFDDLGDRQIDTGQDPQWGIFNLNLFNQSNAKLLERFLRHTGIEDDSLHETLMAAFMRADSASRMYVAKAYIGLVRERFAGLSRSLLETYAIFLKLCKRTLEAGFVNSIGDILLCEDRGFFTGEAEIWNLVAPGMTTEVSRDLGRSSRSE